MSTKTLSTPASKRPNIRMMTVTGMLSALAFALMYLDFSVPFMPSFIKMDVSDLPALIASYCFGPVSGVFVCLIKNLLHLLITRTGGIGELSNFLLGVMFVMPAGFIYQKKKTRISAIMGSVTGALISAAGCILTNYFIVYPVYYKIAMPEEAILGAYQAILPSVESIMESLIIFNAPFTFLKYMICTAILFPFYKHISHLLKGKSAND